MIRIQPGTPLNNSFRRQRASVRRSLQVEGLRAAKASYRVSPHESRRPGGPSHAQALFRRPASHLLVLAFLAGFLNAQTVPPHPRLLFTAADIPSIQARINVSGTEPAAGWNALATYAPTISQQTASSQAHYQIRDKIRKMEEVAFRYAITGNTSYGNSAKAALLSAVNNLVPTGSVAPWRACSYAAVMAATFDMIYPLLSPSEVSTVVNALESWVNAIKQGSAAPGTYSQYSGASDNQSFAWFASVAFILMGIYEHTSLPGAAQDISSCLAKLNSGWKDAISPDGSVDEWVGYANYGPLWSVRTGIASENCGFGDHLQGTNVLKTARWFTSALMAESFQWVGDSTQNHRGLAIDPILYYLAKRTQDAEALWGIQRIFTLLPIGGNSTSQGFSPHLARILHYPDNLAPEMPQVVSGFFRDNLNQGSPGSNKLTNHEEIGAGGHAFLHNSADPNQARLSAFYMIRDEWMNHSHEDDGHFGLSIGNTHLYLDPGYANSQGFLWAQSTDHNIVTVDGVGGFNGGATNYYSPPSPNGRYLGTRKAFMFSPTFDYVRGDHKNMWMMEKADRSVIMIKDPVNPYVILASIVKRNSSTNTYREVFHSASPTLGQGTAASPMMLTGAGNQTVRAVYLSPSAVSVNPGSAMTTFIGNVYRNTVSAAGVEVPFVSIHGASSPQLTQALNQPGPVTKGGTAFFAGYSDKIMVRTGTGTLSDAETSGDGRFAWLRSVSGQLSEWAAAEATQLTHAGATLLASNLPVTIAVRSGRVDVGLQEGVDPTTLQMTIEAPFPVTVVEVEGNSVPFTVQGNQVLVGLTLGSGILSADDRFYSFTQANTGDAIPDANGIVISGRYQGISGWSTLQLKAGDSFQARPLAVSGEVTFMTGASGVEALQRFRDAATGTLRFDVEIGRTPTPFVRVRRNGTVIYSSVPQLDVTGTRVRFVTDYDPTQGTVIITDSLGNQLVATYVGVSMLPFKVDLEVTNFASWDNVGVFDSAEDGVHPQGVVFWALPSGLAGFAVHAPQLTLGQDTSLLMNGTPLSASISQLWFLVSGMSERAYSAYLPSGVPVPATLVEACYESAGTAWMNIPGLTLGVRYVSAAGLEMVGLAGTP